VRLGHAFWAHFVQNNGHAGLSNLPGRLGPRKAAADNVDGFNFAR
jgi:hypothetical protein